MRWATYISPETGADRVGLVVDELIHGLAAPIALLDLLGDDGERLAAAGERAVRDPAEVIPVHGVRLRAPIPQPPAVRDFAAFEDHIVAWLAGWGRKLGPEWYERPIFYFQGPGALRGPGEIPIAPGSVRFDYELEFAAVIGREARNVTLEDAERHIAGYTIMCDWSARDLHDAERGHLIGPMKGKDTATSIGPYLVTPDELEPRRTGTAFDLKMTADVNGRRYSDGNLSRLHWSFAQMLTYASRGTRVLPGEIFGTGTVATGSLMDLRLHDEDGHPWLVPGDEVVLEVEGIGRLEHRIVPGDPIHPFLVGTQSAAGA
ncbi:fumarylacetoacetate hydrolase family protein [Kribbella sandramycini]|uniref:2-keto-4-pentenoate hydratase/2-oxohepta-3-ene-1,7-dioic acid hydratase in catechol pathway n=1 Tax=Kribbella sandramycini TaxID=60450 RepID=A0A7Y4KVV2_9ACTN|nr:fumarylacetoacetate hydrolase family protein [Kribbella sandramycini]MBB6567729.1 2-keto-4-pentenoate hydratase/2-oxohepta-3-ene-1,7-dioic acid hydratase in catechol pathway [Kribbella sandramycini]NOL39674.1 fumarylacetoacetate hydrolase family protein [Kribbella sandramycini]